MFNDQQVQATLKTIPDPQLMQMGQSPVAPTTPMDIQSEIARRAQLRAGVTAMKPAAPVNPMGAQPIGQSPQEQGIAGLPAQNMNGMAEGGIVPSKSMSDWLNEIKGELDRRGEKYDDVKHFYGGGDTELQGGRRWAKSKSGGAELLAAAAARQATPQPPPDAQASEPDEGGIAAVKKNVANDLQTLFSFLKNPVGNYAGTGAVFNAPTVPPPSPALDAQASAPVGQPAPAAIVIPPSSATAVPPRASSGSLQDDIDAALQDTPSMDVLNAVGKTPAPTREEAVAAEHATKLGNIKDYYRTIMDLTGGEDVAGKQKEITDRMLDTRNDPLTQGILTAAGQVAQGGLDARGLPLGWAQRAGAGLGAGIKEGQATQASNDLTTNQVGIAQLAALKEQDAIKKAAAMQAIGETGQDTRAQAAAQVAAWQQARTEARERAAMAQTQATLARLGAGNSAMEARMQNAQLLAAFNQAAGSMKGSQWFMMLPLAEQQKQERQLAADWGIIPKGAGGAQPAAQPLPYRVK